MRWERIFSSTAPFARAAAREFAIPETILDRSVRRVIAIEFIDLFVASRMSKASIKRLVEILIESSIAHDDCGL